MKGLTAKRRNACWKDLKKASVTKSRGKGWLVQNEAGDASMGQTKDEKP